MQKTRHRAGGLLGILLLGILLALAAACTPSHPQSTFDTLGPVARGQAVVFWIIFGLGALVFVIVEGIILYAVFKYRRRPNDGDPEQIHGNDALEITWTVIPAVILVVAAIPTLMVLYSTTISPEPPEKGGFVVEATGHQWWFEFKYPGYDDLVTANEMHIPVDEVINVDLRSKDVIHSFWVPKLAGKVDMIPNNDNTLWLKAEREGEYYAQCAEFCGVSHANMRFKVVAESWEDFNAWVEEQLAEASSPVDPLAKEGEELFMSQDSFCFRCHAVRGTRLARGHHRPGPHARGGPQAPRGGAARQHRGRLGRRERRAAPTEPARMALESRRREARQHHVPRCRGIQRHHSTAYRQPDRRAGRLPADAQVGKPKGRPQGQSEALNDNDTA